MSDGGFLEDGGTGGGPTWLPEMRWPLKVITIRLPMDLQQQLKEQANIDGTSLNQMCVGVLESYVNVCRECREDEVKDNGDGCHQHT